MRRPTLAVITLALCSAGVATTAVLADAGGEPAGTGDVNHVAAHAGVNGDHLSGRAGSDTIESQQADPTQRGAPGWGVVVFTAKNGQTCAAPGRLGNGALGQLREDGSVMPYPIENGASCINFADAPAGAQVSTGRYGRTVVHGLAGPTIASVTLKTPSATRMLPIGPRGSFLAVLANAEPPSALTVTVKLKDGSAKTLLG